MSLYQYGVQFITFIVGENAPEFLYTISFVLFIVLFFGLFLKIICLIFKMVSSRG